MTFGEAIEQAKHGKRVTRAGWNGKGMWVGYVPDNVVHSDVLLKRSGLSSALPRGPIDVGAYLVMWTSKGTLQPGYLGSQCDMLADDWAVVADEATP